MVVTYFSFLHLPSSCSSSSPNTLSPSPSSTCSSSSSSSSSPCCAPSAPSRQLLLDAASAITDGNLDVAAATIDRLKLSAANLHGDPDQRVTAYMVAALHARIKSLISSPEGVHPFLTAELCSIEHLRATQLLYESSPCFYPGFVAANLTILDAAWGQPKIHIVDFDVGQGLQYTALVKAIAERPAS